MAEPTLRRNKTASTAGAVTLPLALIFAAIFIVTPFIYNFILSFKNFNAMHGIFSSPWAGLENYAEILKSDQFWSSVIWTVRYSAINAAVLFVLSLGAGALLNIIHIKWLRHALCTVLLLPLVVPGEIWARAFIGIFTTENIAGIWLLPAWSALKYVGLSALLVTASLSHGRRSASLPLLSARLSALAVFTLLGRADFTLLKDLYSPENGIRLLDNFMYYGSLVGRDYGATVAGHILVLATRCLLLAAAAWPVAAMLRRLFPATASPAPTLPRDRLISLAAAGAIAVAALTALGTVKLVLGSGGNIGGAELQLLPSILLHTALALVTSLINTAFCFLLARPAACGGKTGRKGKLAVLILFTAMSMAAYSIGEYFIFKSLGLMNTLLAVALCNIGAVWGVWPLLLAAKGLGVESDADWFRHMWKPALGLFAVQAAIQANNTIPSLLYNTEANYHPLNLLQNIGFMRHTDINATYGIGLIAVMMLVLPVALLLAVRTVFNEKDNMALFMPGK